LERARKEPKKFAESKIGGFGGLRPTFSMYWVLAAKLYHKLKADNEPNARQKAVAYFNQTCQSKLGNNKDFNRKVPQLAGKLDDYIASYAGLNCGFVQANKRVVFDKIPGHFVSGRIDRFDIDPTGGYLATNFETISSDWSSRLRVPILQQALADELGCPASEIKVGVFCVETANHDYVSVSDADIASAVRELETLLNVIESELRRLRDSTRQSA